jgi:Ni/Fe-hydrogenase subunit HybB-like protein
VRHWETYVPSLGEVGITLGITAAAVFAFGYLARILPIHEELPAPETRPLPAARAAGAWHGVEGVS